jgi:hypothetical protein
MSYTDAVYFETISRYRLIAKQSIESEQNGAPQGSPFQFEGSLWT